MRTFSLAKVVCPHAISIFISPQLLDRSSSNFRPYSPMDSVGSTRKHGSFPPWSCLDIDSDFSEISQSVLTLWHDMTGPIEIKNTISYSAIDALSNGVFFKRKFNSIKLGGTFIPNLNKKGDLNPKPLPHVQKSGPRYHFSKRSWIFV